MRLDRTQNHLMIVLHFGMGPSMSGGLRAPEAQIGKASARMTNVVKHLRMELPPILLNYSLNNCPRRTVILTILLLKTLG